MRRLDHFHGGIHPDEHKLESSELPSRIAPLPPQLILSLHQHIGAGAKVQVQAGDHVLKGQLLASAQGMVSAAIHAPTSGTVTAVRPHAVPHPSQLPGLCVHIEPDGKDQWIEHAPLAYRAIPKSELLAKLREAGIVGLGGATFPTHVKYSLAPDQRIQTLVINGAECEPWITTDDRLMRERAAEIVRGIEVLRHLAAPAETLIGIEDNKPQAIAAMRAACADSDIEVVIIPTLYPSGGEKQLIKILTGKEVPSGGRPTGIGVACSNVATAFAIHRFVDYGEPLISRQMTVTGNVRTPQNIEVLIGTPLQELVRLAEPLPGVTGYILGGPMMGVDIEDLRLPVVKGSNCIIVKSAKLFPPAEPAMPCIRCTRCAAACPADLQPQELHWFSKARDFGKAQEYNLFDCIECGACAYVCPSHIPLVQYFRFAKSEIWQRERESQAAEVARERHEFRLARIEREKQEKAERLAQKEREATAAREAITLAQALAAKQAAKQAADPDFEPDNTQQMRINAAIERAKAQVAAENPKNTEVLTPQQQAEIAEIEARRAKLREAAAHPGADDEPPKHS
ncbi:MAG: electron transport complex subunit RsxC [Gammaproteobacteria bacterium]|nr:electron transport complex subunit RsxC [Gammaproteobacteria bacterium]MBU1481870.1 electron transport complex subunit RsxC [Gammaproteobacteria bacterium]